MKHVVCRYRRYVAAQTISKLRTAIDRPLDRRVATQEKLLATDEFRPRGRVVFSTENRGFQRCPRLQLAGAQTKTQLATDGVHMYYRDLIRAAPNGVERTEKHHR
jgi:hypothetical protein